MTEWDPESKGWKVSLLVVRKEWGKDRHTTSGFSNGEGPGPLVSLDPRSGRHDTLGHVHCTGEIWNQKTRDLATWPPTDAPSLLFLVPVPDQVKT